MVLLHRMKLTVILRRFAPLHTLGQFVGSGYRLQGSVGGIVESESR